MRATRITDQLIPANPKRHPWETDLHKEAEARHSEAFREAVEEDMEEARDRIHPQAVEAMLADIPVTNAESREEKQILTEEYAKCWERYAENQKRLKDTRAEINALIEEQKKLQRLLETASRISELTAHEDQLIAISKKKAKLADRLARYQVGETAFSYSLLQTVDHISVLAAPYRPTLEMGIWDDGRGSGIRRIKKTRPPEETDPTGTDDGDFTI